MKEAFEHEIDTIKAPAEQPRHHSDSNPTIKLVRHGQPLQATAKMQAVRRPVRPYFTESITGTASAAVMGIDRGGETVKVP
jgi:hypothetical protein